MDKNGLSLLPGTARNQHNMESDIFPHPSNSSESTKEAMPESIHAMDPDSWLSDSLSHVRTRKGTIIGPDKTWGKFVFTSRFGLVEEISSEQQQQQEQPQQQHTIGEIMTTAIQGSEDIEQDDKSQNRPNIVTPLRTNRRLHFYSSSSTSQNCMKEQLRSENSPPIRSINIRDILPEEIAMDDEQEPEMVVAAVEDSPRSPPRIVRWISSNNHEHSPFLGHEHSSEYSNHHQLYDDEDYYDRRNNSNNDKKNQLNVLVQAVDLVTFDAATVLVGSNDGHGDHDDTEMHTLPRTSVHAQRLREKRNRRLRPTWN